MKLYIMRHGETNWNVERRLQGRSDISLNERGIKLAEITAEGLRDIPLDVIYSSPLSRAKETADIIGRNRDISVICDDRLVEMGFGSNEGLLKEERTGDVMRLFKKPEEYVPIMGAESIEEVVERTKCFLDEIIFPMAVSNPCANVMICGHGAMNKALVTNLEHRTKAQFWDGNWQYNCCINLYEITGDKIETLWDAKVFYDIGSEVGYV